MSRNDLTRGDGAGLRVSNDPSRMNDSGARTQAPIPAASNENHEIGEARQVSQGATHANEIEQGPRTLTGRSDHPMKPRLLDLFCGAGGCSVGYARVGFDVRGVDIAAHPSYPFTLVQADAVEYLQRQVEWIPEFFTAVHASPPCQRYSHMGQRYANTQAEHPDLIGPIRELLQATGLPYVIENVMGARDEMPEAIRLCGSSFGLGVHRHRLFETNFPVMAPPCAHNGTAIEGLPVYGKLDGRRIWTRADGSELRAPKTLEEAQAAMGIDWMDWDDLREAIPPAYTEHIGHYLLAHVQQERIAA